jgi:trigger factor
VVGEYRRKTRLPGFRKGKAPASIVSQRFRKEIEQDVVDRLVQRYWRQAEAEKELEPLLAPEVKGVDFELGESLVFTAVVETRPEITLGNLEGFELPEMEIEPPEEDVAEQIDGLRRRLASWRTVDRPAARGDRVRVEAGPEGGEARSTTIEVGDPNVWEELSLAVTGLAAGQEASFERAQAGGGPPRRHSMRLLEVLEAELPPLDDELVRKISNELQSVEELREHMRGRLREARSQERRRRRERALLQQLLQRHPIQLPEGVVQHDLEELVRDYAHQLAHQGVDLERSQIDWPSLAEQFLQEAQRRVHARLLLDAVVDAREIRVPEESLEAVLAEIGRSRGVSTVAVRRDLDQSGRLAGLRRQLRRQEALRQLMGEPEGPAEEGEGLAVESPADRT